MAGRNGKWKDTPVSLKIKRRMLNKGLSMTQLSKMTGIDKTSLAITIYGKRKGETYIRYLKLILEVLDIKDSRTKSA